MPNVVGRTDANEGRGPNCMTEDTRERIETILRCPAEKDLPRDFVLDKES